MPPAERQRSVPANAAVDDIVDKVSERIVQAMVAEADPIRAAGERKYLKTDLYVPDRVHIGVPVPRCRELVRGALKAAGPIGHDEVLGLIGGLWERPEFEFKRAATEIAVRHAGSFTGPDVDLIEGWMRTAHTWALIDEWAPRVIGRLYEDERSRGLNYDVGERLDAWVSDPDFWIRRSAVLALLIPLRSGKGDFDRFVRYGDALMGDTEFFIRKAIGWVGREVARKRPELVADWVRERARSLSTVTFREATRNLPDELRIPLTELRNTR